MKQAKRLLNCLTGDEGFTLIETLISVIIFLIAVVTVWGLALTLSLNFSKAGGRATDREKILQFDTFLRQSVSHIAIPFWANTLWEISENHDKIVIPWLYGDTDKIFEIYFADNEIIAKTDTGEIVLHNVDSFFITILKDKSNTNIGLEVRYIHDGIEYTTQELFGAWSLIPGI
jgi:prepilin-type N-terminal cleavage/methylation domain-containing protein